MESRKRWSLWEVVLDGESRVPPAAGFVPPTCLPVPGRRSPWTFNRHFRGPRLHPQIPGLGQEADPRGRAGGQAGRPGAEAGAGSCLGSSPGFLTAQITPPESQRGWLSETAGPRSPRNPEPAAQRSYKHPCAFRHRKRVLQAGVLLPKAQCSRQGPLLSEHKKPGA